MNIKIKDKELRRMLILQLTLILIGVLAILLIKTDIIKLIPPCMVRDVTGVICLTCGVTRCISNMMDFNFDIAFLYHPVFFILVVYIIFIDIVYIINTLFKKKFLKFLYPSLGCVIVFYALFIIQYIYRLVVILKFNGLQYL